ncbi:hypothetical protein PRZ48_010307 [Zasmidium cellare]|uniref:F-box domain-containing protein n=1 Tax=Zasmidium cellare TaxID=395010 RepID=A0ABR0E8K6_ZASCE|nr:hypothetical protein PRZ48_010307 [Zasmidium cellare]
MRTSPLLDLPTEVRLSILGHALRQPGTLELQHPVWTGLQDFCQPLFHVCRSLRQEALEAFYGTNDFLWIVDTENRLRSDPSTYPAPAAVVDKGKYVQPSVDTLLTPVLPWEYPHLFHHLRHLQINLYLPQDSDASALHDRLTALVKATDRGKRLAEFHVLITGKRRGSQMPLSAGERDALEVLAQMEVRGCVEVQTRYYFRAVSAGVRALDLQRRMTEMG